MSQNSLLLPTFQTVPSAQKMRRFANVYWCFILHIQCVEGVTKLIFSFFSTRLQIIEKCGNALNSQHVEYATQITPIHILEIFLILFWGGGAEKRE